MKKILNVLALSILFFTFGCDIQKDELVDHDIMATINGEEWYFYDVTTSTTAEGDAQLEGKGYLMGDRGAEAADLRIVFVGTPSLEQAGEGFTADFAPTNAGTSAYAILEFPTQNRTFDTKLDPATTGTFTITEINNNTMAGKFDFNVKDQLGNIAKVESAEFQDIPISQ